MKLNLRPVVLALAFFAPRGHAQDLAPAEPVGRASGGRTVTPVNQITSPAGQQLDLPGLRPQALALSPDGKLLAVSGKSHEVLLIDPATVRVLQTVPLPSEEARAEAEPVSAHELQPDKEGQVSYTGLVFAPDGSRLYLANVNGSIKVFDVDKDHHVKGNCSYPLPPANAPRRKAEIPAGLAVSRDGKFLYVALNLGNRLAELDAANGRVRRVWEVGVAPYDVVLAAHKAYVSNWGGRRPAADSVIGPAGQGTRVRVDSTRYVASEGSISVIDLAAGMVTGEIITGTHCCAMALSPNGRYLAAANAQSDNVSIIDTRKDQVVETICARQSPADLLGATPNALVFDPSGRQLFVCNGTQNAVAEISFKAGESKLKGLIPTGWFPGAIVFDASRRTLCVANIKGLGEGRPARAGRGVEFNSHQYYGSLSVIPEPSAAILKKLTSEALFDMRYPMLAQAALPARSGQPARPVPERAGEPSVFQHVVYVIKENRTYDQVLGDVKEGNGNSNLCVFGENVTPNQHKFVHDFVLLDNTYCSGILSADGHQWADSAMATDYMEKSFAGFPRSYPDGMGDNEVDALAYSKAGFIWDDAIAHGKTLRDYGEFGITRKSWKDPSRKGKPRFADHYNEFIKGTDTINLYSDPGIESLRPYLVKATVGWDLSVPDVFRARKFMEELKQFEQTGQFPNLIIICLPNDHTSGTGVGSPTPAAQVADNDLAFGQIVEAISHSRFWKDTCILGIEDDPQAGWDHVSGYRTTAYVISAYTKRRQVVGTQYNQTSLLRTMELMLGLPPMNQLDATATPMSDCFVATPDFTPFSALPANIPLDQMNPDPKKISDAGLRHDAYASARLPLSLPDQCPENLLNRILWRAMKGPQEPFPAWAIPARDDDD
jgi:YVTN family beta-propeller protein